MLCVLDGLCGPDAVCGLDAACARAQVWPEAVADFKRELRALISAYATDGPLFQLVHVHGDDGWCCFYGPRQLADRCTKATSVAAGTQTRVDVELEGAIGEDREGLRKLSARGEPSGGLFEDQPRGAHERPPIDSAATSFFFLRIDSPSISMRYLCHVSRLAKHQIPAKSTARR